MYSLTMNMPRKMKELECVENNEKKKNVDMVFMKSLEGKRHIRKHHRRGWKDSNKMDLSV